MSAPDRSERIAQSRARLVEAAARIVTGVRDHGERYLVSRTGRLLDAWGRVEATDRPSVDDALARAASQATTRVAGELEALFALDVAEQRTTPLTIVRTIGAEPTAVLAELGVPPVERDAFARRHDPDDVYDLAPADPGALGDPDLGALHMVWGLAKSDLMRRDDAC